MDYQYLKEGDGKLNVSCLLTIQELKLLYNAAIEMIKTTTAEDNSTLTDAYKSVVVELEDIIVYQEYKQNVYDYAKDVF